jgi:hypothetical protein
LQRCRGCTNRPQGFSPSRRRTPTRTSWLCFTPHPPLGFWSSERSPLRQPQYLSILVALLSSRQPAGSPANRFPSRPLLSLVHLAHRWQGTAPRSRRAPLSRARHRPHQSSDLRRTTDPASGPRNPEGCRTAFSRFAPHPQWVSCNDLDQARASTSEPLSGEESVPGIECYPDTRPMLS